MAEADNKEMAQSAKKYWSAEGYLPGGVIREVDYSTQSGGLDPMFAGIKIVDTDTHIVEPPSLFTDRAPAGMKDRPLAKALVATVLAAVCSLLALHDSTKWRGLGRDAFLVHEAARFDKVIASAHPLAGVAVGLMVFVVIGLYEGAVALVSRLLSRGT